MIRVLIAIVGIASLATQAFAELPENEAVEMAAIEADLKAVEACFKEATTLEGVTDCTRLTHQVCLERRDDWSRVGMADCLSVEVKIWELIYSSEFILASERAKRTDHGYLGFRDGGSGRLQRFVQAEAVWQTHAKNQCDLEMERWGSGTIRSLELPACRMRMLAERAFFLRELEFG